MKWGYRILWTKARRLFLDPEIRRRVIRGVLVPLGLGLFALSREGYRVADSGLLHFVAAYIFGAFLLGASQSRGVDMESAGPHRYPARGPGAVPALRR